MGKVNKNKHDELPKEFIDDSTPVEQPNEVIQPDTLDAGNTDEPQSAEAVVDTTEVIDHSDAEAEEKAIKDAEDALREKMKNPPVADQSVINSIVDKDTYTVVFINDYATLKAGAERTVSGNVAKALIKKGLVRLK
jgi:hypothetical protein